jgi:hypothetical protein
MPFRALAESVRERYLADKLGGWRNGRIAPFWVAGRVIARRRGEGSRISLGMVKNCWCWQSYSICKVLIVYYSTLHV